MTAGLRLAFTADLHWGIRPAGDAATRLMLDFLEVNAPDVLVLAGDIGAGHEFEPCLALFDRFNCRKALVPGNHDIWVVEDDPRGDSLRVYHEHLPALCAAHGFDYLDGGPLYLADGALALVGTINWYDYSWSIEQLRVVDPDWEEHLRMKRFSRGRHNDARFVRWVLDDSSFTAEIVSTFERQLVEALGRAERAIVVTHHAPFLGINFPRPEPVTPDGLLWEAFAGNRSIEDVLLRHADRIPFAFCGHTHRAREGYLGPVHGFNIGGDYHFKRLLLLDWPAGNVEAHVFGNPEAH